MIEAAERAPRRNIGIGDRVRVRLPHSEVMVHMGLAGKCYEIVLVGDTAIPMVSVLNGRGVPFTTVMPSEAGVFSGSGTHYVYPEAQ